MPPKDVQPISPAALREWIEGHGRLTLLDVRSDGERRNLPFYEAIALDPEAEEEIAKRPKGEPLVFVCYRGVRSLAAAKRYLELGFAHVYSLEGGLETWVRELGRPPLPSLALSA